MKSRRFMGTPFRSMTTTYHISSVLCVTAKTRGPWVEMGQGRLCRRFFHLEILGSLCGWAPADCARWDPLLGFDGTRNNGIATRARRPMVSV
jgi:hypothetical protein